MNQTPAQQWTALSALYEQADALPPDELPVWLAELERQGHAMLPQLKAMLNARAQIETDDFLGTLPKLAPTPLAESGWKTGDRVGAYRLVRPLGEGGMAEVWLAERDDGAFKRRVAIKLPFPRPGRETFAVRFDRERDILATLRHPHIANLFDAGVTSNGQAWIALEYVEGQPIGAWCDERQLPVRDRVALFRQVLLAVQHAHTNLVIHRDLKPANILVTDGGEVRLLDFGIAKLLESEGDAIAETELTRAAGRSLTPRYASPEQLQGRPLTTASDVYALGVVLYELICGHRPYELKVESIAQLEHAILEIEPRAPSRRELSELEGEARGVSIKQLRRVLAPELDAIALKCLQKSVGRRYSSVDALMADVDRWLDGDAVLARSPGAWTRAWKFAARHKWGAGLGLAAIVGLMATTAVAVVMGVQARQESARAGAARDFMLSLFERADQEKSRGANLTARELLDTGRKQLVSQLGTQPQLQAELLNGIGTIQHSMGEYVAAEATFAEAAERFRAIAFARDEALAMAARAEAALRMGRIDAAQRLIDAARSKPGNFQHEAAVIARMQEVGGWVDIQHNDGQAAKLKFLESRAQAVRAHGEAHLTVLNAIAGLIHAERLLRNYDESLKLQTQAEKTAAAIPGIGPKTRVELDLTRAQLTWFAGRFAQGLAHLQDALPRCIDIVGPHEESCRRLLMTKVQTLLRLGWADAPAEDIAGLEELARDATSPALRVEAMLTLVRVYAVRGDEARRDETMRELEQTVRIDDKQGNRATTLKVRTWLTLAESRLREGQTTRALDAIGQVSRLRPAAGADRPTLSGATAQMLTGVALMQQREFVRARDLLRAAQEDMVAVLGDRHPVTLLYSLNQALALEGMGRPDEAMALVQRAQSPLLEALGADSVVYLRVRALGERLFVESRNALAGIAPGPVPAPKDLAAEFFS